MMSSKPTVVSKSLKQAKLKITKAKPMDPTKPRYEAFQEVILPEKTSYKFKQSDVFEVSKPKVSYAKPKKGKNRSIRKK